MIEDKDNKIAFRRYMIDLIMRNGFVSFDEMCEIAKTKFNYRAKTAERRMNKSESPMIETCYNEIGKRYKTGYRWKTYTPAQTQEERLVEATIML